MKNTKGKRKEKELSERHKRYLVFLEHMVEVGGFSKKQAVYLINLLDEYIPLI